VVAEALVSRARLKYLRSSAQKTRLVVDLIRGRQVGDALSTLRFTKKSVAQDIGQLLDSAIANARQKRQELDVDRLYVQTAYVDGGPSLKRIRPAPMGRAFRVLKRMCHVTIELGEREAPQTRAARQSASEGTEKPSVKSGVGKAKTGQARPRGPARKTKTKRSTKRS
jgi:large subunit ribosomal protein L22